MVQCEVGAERPELDGLVLPWRNARRAPMTPEPPESTLSGDEVQIMASDEPALDPPSGPSIKGGCMTTEPVSMNLPSTGPISGRREYPNIGLEIALLVLLSADLGRIVPP